MLCMLPWDAIGAMSTAAAVIVAMFGSWLALKTPEWSRQRDRQEATHEVLRAVREAIEIYRGAVEMAENNAWRDDLVTMMRIRATHLNITLDRLIDRPALTDGAIAIGAGAMSVLASLAEIPSHAEAKDLRAANSSNPALARFVDAVGPATTVLNSAADVIKVVEDRADKVEAYILRRWWHKFRN